MTGKRAFTLIELLIVVAIIAILAAIAVPNFLEAQVRAKASRVRSDLRALAMAMEAYRVDWNSYTFAAPSADRGDLAGWVQITTPVAYISRIPSDPFGHARSVTTFPPPASPAPAPVEPPPTPTPTPVPAPPRPKPDPIYNMGAGAVGIATAGTPSAPNRGMPSNAWMMNSNGPDHIDQTVSVTNYPTTGYRWTWGEASYPAWNAGHTDPALISDALSLLYDPTNGTISDGNILRLGGMRPPGPVFDMLYSLSSR